MISNFIGFTLSLVIVIIFGFWYIKHDNIDSFISGNPCCIANVSIIKSNINHYFCDNNEVMKLECDQKNYILDFYNIRETFKSIIRRDYDER